LTHWQFTPERISLDYSVGSLENIEVDDQSQRDIEQFHVAEQLCLIDNKNLFDRFAF
jgi:hypothetical protein